MNNKHTASHHITPHCRSILLFWGCWCSWQPPQHCWHTKQLEVYRGTCTPTATLPQVACSFGYTLHGCCWCCVVLRVMLCCVMLRVMWCCVCVCVVIVRVISKVLLLLSPSSLFLFTFPPSLSLPLPVSLTLPPCLPLSFTGLLTSLDRSSFAKVYHILANHDVVNQQSLNIMNTALFFLCLDDEAPANIQELSRLMLHRCVRVCVLVAIRNSFSLVLCALETYFVSFSFCFRLLFV